MSRGRLRRARYNANRSAELSNAFVLFAKRGGAFRATAGRRRHREHDGTSREHPCRDGPRWNAHVSYGRRSRRITFGRKTELLVWRVVHAGD